MKKLICILLFVFSLPAFSAEDFYLFKTSAEATRFKELTSEFRCLVCQNQTIAESNATLASDLRDQVFKRMQRGDSDKEIIKYLVSRYGDFILYKPPFNAATFALWSLPFIFLLIGLGYLFIYVVKRK